MCQKSMYQNNNLVDTRCALPRAAGVHQDFLSSFYLNVEENMRRTPRSTCDGNEFISCAFRTVESLNLKPLNKEKPFSENSTSFVAKSQP